MQQKRLASRAARWAILGALCAAPSAFAADGSPWLGAPATGYLSLAYVFQSADEFYTVSGEKGPTPGDGEDLEQRTTWLTGGYTINDDWGLDMQIGHATSDFITGPGIPAEMDSYSGLVDANFGLTYRIVDEATGGLPSVAVRGGVIVAGDYMTGNINALGDGGDGLELSLIVGKFFTERLGFSAELGYRNRNNDIPENYFTNLVGYVLASERLSFAIDYRRVDSGDGLTIGGPGFSPRRFPEVEEETQMLGGRLFATLTEQLSLALFYSHVLDGANTPKSDVIGASVSYSFSTY